MKAPSEFNGEKDVEIAAETYRYRGYLSVKHYRLRHRLYAGGWSEYLEREVLIRGPVAAALPYDPVRNQVVLIQQFRVGALEQPSPWLWEIVAGIADESNETLVDLVQRELREESGLVAKKLHQMHEFWVSPGGCNEKVTLFCAQVDSSLASGIHGVAAEHEDILVQAIPCDEAFKMVADGRINNAITLIALQWLQLHQNIFT